MVASGSLAPVSENTNTTSSTLDKTDAGFADISFDLNNEDTNPDSKTDPADNTPSEDDPVKTASGDDNISTAPSGGDKASSVPSGDDPSYDRSLPHIIPSSFYEPQEDKVLFFYIPAGDADKNFIIRDTFDGSIQWEGHLTQLEDGYYKGEFTDFNREGTYFAQIKKYGRSTPFTIQKGSRDKLFDKCLAALKGLPIASSSIINKCRNIFVTLQAMELFKSKLNIQDYSSLLKPHIDYLSNINDQRLTVDELYYSCAILAKYSRLISEDEPRLAEDYLSEATNKSSVAALMNSGPSAAQTLSNIELYRAGGRIDRLAQPNEYLEGLKDKDLSFDEFLAVVSYLNTPGDTDTKLCSGLITGIMRDAEEIAASCRTSVYMIYEPEGASLPSGVLEQAHRLCVVNYIIKNHEYDTLSIQYLHYLLGRNPHMDNYVDSIIKEGENLPLLFFLLAAI